MAKLDYVDPELLVRNVAPTVLGIFQKPETVAHLTDHQKSACLEKYQVASLAFMMKRIAGRHADITVYPGEFEDGDCVIRASIDGKIEYKPVQLKQLSNHEMDKKAGLQAIIDGLKNKYRDSVVAIWVGRDIEVDFNLLRLDDLCVEQLWLLGDSVTGEPMLRGGHILDLRAGVCWVCKMSDGQTRIGRIDWGSPQNA